MKKAVLVIFSLALACTAIAKQHKPKKRHKAGNEIESVVMRRTGCYGRCPAYIIELDKNGMATYTALRFTEDSGVLTKNLNAKATSDILQQVLISRIDTCKDEYPSRATDLPGLIFTIKYAKFTKTINNANFGPPVLRQLSETMDGIVGKKADDTWKRTTTAGK